MKGRESTLPRSSERRGAQTEWNSSFRSSWCPNQSNVRQIPRQIRRLLFGGLLRLEFCRHAFQFPKHFQRSVPANIDAGFWRRSWRLYLCLWNTGRDTGTLTRSHLAANFAPVWRQEPRSRGWQRKYRGRVEISAPGGFEPHFSRRLGNISENLASSKPRQFKPRQFKPARRARPRGLTARH